MLKASMSEAAWTQAQTKGWATDGSADTVAQQTSGRAPNSQPGATSSARASTYEAPQFDGDVNAYPFHFLPYPSQAFADGSTAHLPWMQELPDPLTSAMWSSWVELNPTTAGRLNIGQGDLVDVTSSQGTVRVPAVVFPGIAPDVIAMPVGQGHERFTRYASKRGANPIAILAPVTEPETGALAWAATRVRIARAGNDDGSLILFAGEMRERPHAHETR
jgi:anaerobic selenocysteine-containing dehydrogenase